jgi:hypothetical protein
MAVFKWNVSKPILFNVVAVDFVVSGEVERTLHTVCVTPTSVQIDGSVPGLLSV